MLAPRIGRFRLQEQNVKVPLVRTFHDQPVNNDNLQIVLESKFALYCPHDLIPENIRAPFSAAGSKISEDFHRFSRSLVFLPELLGQDDQKQRVSAGFVFSMVKGVAPEQAIELDHGLPEALRPDMNSIIFLHPLDEEGTLKEDQYIHWDLAALIGRAKIGHLDLTAHPHFSDLEQEAYALMYQKSFSQSLIDVGFGGREYFGACRFLISGLSQMISGYHLTAETSDRLAGLL